MGSRRYAINYRRKQLFKNFSKPVRATGVCTSSFACRRTFARDSFHYNLQLFLFPSPSGVDAYVLIFRPSARELTYFILQTRANYIYIYIHTEQKPGLVGRSRNICAVFVQSPGIFAFCVRRVPRPIDCEIYICHRLGTMAEQE